MATEPKKFEGLSGAMRTSPWLAGEDLVGLGDINAKIEEVFEYENIQFEAGRTVAKVFALKFVDKQKQLVLNATNRKVVARAFGSDTRKWRGQEVKISFDPTVRMKGQTVGGIRIKL